MYDPVTRSLLQAVPQLAGLNREALPELLTRVFGQLVSMRLAARNNSLGSSPDPVDLEVVRRLANALETFAAVAPESEQRRGAAFVSATAHSLLRLRAPSTNPEESDRSHPAVARPGPDILERDWISADMSACLLFLVAGQTADAAEMARHLVVDDEPSIEASLVRAISALARGELSSASRETSGDVPRPDTPEQALYLQTRAALRLLLAELAGNEREERALDTLARIERRCVSVGTGELAAVTSAFFGPHHLCRLLRLAAGQLLGVRTTGITPPPGIEASAWRSLISGIASSRPFLWQSHVAAVRSDFLRRGVSAVLTFPTGSGKSLMAELKIAATLCAGGTIVYLAPTHALVSQAARDLRGTFTGVRVVEALVDDGAANDIDDEGAIFVMTPERALARMGSSEEASGCSLLIMDECHLMHPGQPERARRSLDAAFCLMTMTSAEPEMDVVLMSAMIENGAELAGWVAHLTGRTCVSLTVDWKPTRQLRGCLVFPEGETKKLDKLIARERSTTKNSGPSAALKRAAVATPSALFSLRQTWATHERDDYVLTPLTAEKVQLSVGAAWSLTANRFVVAAALAGRFTRSGSRVLVFADSPKNAEKTARDVMKDDSGTIALTPDEAALRSFAREDIGVEDVPPETAHPRVAVHHGLLLGVERLLAESLFRRGTGVVLIGTPTLAQGVNLPADVVILAGDERWDPAQEKNVALAPEEVLNAVARAGRAGFAAVGVVLVVPGTVVPFSPQSKRLGSRWFDLQESVFSKMDQCLKVDDPVELMIDIVQDSSTLSHDARYFLNRLPADAEAARRFLQRTFGAYRARLAGDLARTERVDVAIRRRSADIAPAAEWVVPLATAAGVSIEFGNAIERELRLHAERWTVASVRGVVKAFFAWAEAEPAVLSSLARVTTPDPAEEDYERSPTTRLKRVALMWVRPRTLLEIETYLCDGKALTTCWAARKCVLRELPDVAYAIGVVAQAYRLSDAGGGSIPPALSIASECLRAGLPSAVALAVWYERKGRSSRVSCAATAAELDLDLDLDTATFAEVRRHVRLALN